MKLLFARKSLMFFKTPINWWFVAFLGVLIASLWITHVARVKSAVRETTVTVTTTLNKAYQAKLDKAISDAIKTTQKLQQDADRLKEIKYATIESVNRKLTADVVSLQHRAKRPTSPTIIANDSNNRSSCTADKLYREDAEFLTREAARAEGVLIERDYYYDRYETVRKGINPK